MEAVSVRVICAVLALALLVLIVLRRRQKARQ